MKKKIGLGLLFLLVNLIFGVVSFRVYQNLEGRVSTFELNQRAYVESTQRLYDAQFKKWELAHEKTVSKLLKILGVDNEYDFNNALVSKDNLKKFLNHHVYVKTNLLFEIPKNLKETIPKELLQMNPNISDSVKRGGEAPAVVIGKYVLMASHTNDPEEFNKEVIRLPTPHGIFEVQFKLNLLEKKVAVLLPGGAELILKELYRNREKDFSLFELPKNVRALNFPFKVGDTNEIKIGQFVYINGRPIFKYEVARPGFVTSLFNVGGTYGEIKEEKDHFGISQSTDNGDSGSPIIAFRDGRPEIIGIYLGYVSIDHDNGKNTRSRAVKINIVVDEIKEKTGIDLRDLQHKILFAK